MHRVFLEGCREAVAGRGGPQEQWDWRKGVEGRLVFHYFYGLKKFKLVNKSITCEQINK